MPATTSDMIRQSRSLPTPIGFNVFAYGENQSYTFFPSLARITVVIPQDGVFITDTDVHDADWYEFSEYHTTQPEEAREDAIGDIYPDLDIVGGKQAKKYLLDYYHGFFAAYDTLHYGVFSNEKQIIHGMEELPIKWQLALATAAARRHAASRNPIGETVFVTRSEAVVLRLLDEVRKDYLSCEHLRLFFAHPTGATCHTVEPDGELSRAVPGGFFDWRSNELF